MTAIEKAMHDEISTDAVARELWNQVLPSHETPALTVTGDTEQLPSLFHVEELAAATIGASHMAASYLRSMSTCEEPGGVVLDVSDAAAAFCSERFLRVNGEALAGWAPLSGDYRAGDGQWVRLHCNFEHHARAAAQALECEETREAFARAVEQRTAVEVEEAVIASGGASGAQRSPIEWDAHPQCWALAATPVICAERVGTAAPALPHRRIRVLDLTRIIAGPLAAKVLAGYGADVIHVGSSRLPTIDALDIDHGFGKRYCDIDIATPEGAAELRNLVSNADVFLESYRPGALERYGFGFDDVRALRPDIVYVSLSAYGDEGPWAGRRGFDSVVQLTSGITSVAADDDCKPRALPCQALDHATGYLAALAVVSSLIKRASEGGAWRAKVSLARTAELLWSLGLRDRSALENQAGERVPRIVKTIKSGIGEIRFVPVPGRIGRNGLATLGPLIRNAPPAWV